MIIERRIAALFRLDDETWRRHANPWSVVLRNAALPVLILAFWSRLWLGWWALVPVTVALLWTWLNPRIFPPPRFFDHWNSKGVLGERVWLNRDAVSVPAHHRRAPNILPSVSGIGLLFVAWGMLTFAAWPTLVGAALVYVGKLWFPRPHGLALARLAGRDGGVPGMGYSTGHMTRVLAVVGTGQDRCRPLCLR